MMRRTAAATLVVLALVAPARAQVIEPKSGVNFPPTFGSMSILGTGLRVKKVALVSAKVYAIGLYVSTASLSGNLSQYKGKTASPEFYNELRSGDFEKQVNLVFTRDLSASQLQDGFREVLQNQDQSKVALFTGFFPDVKNNQQASMHWGPGGRLEVTIAGLKKVPIDDKAFTTAVFSIWLGDKPIQEDIKKGLVSRADQLIK